MLVINLVALAADVGVIGQLGQQDRKGGRIDILWSGGYTSPLMLMLACLMKRTDRWIDAEIRILVQGQKRQPEETRTEIGSLLEEIRIDASVEVVDNMNTDSIVETCGESALIFLPIEIESTGPVAALDIDLEVIVERMPLVVMCIAGNDVELEAEPG
jgi:hypothetical protein